MDQLLTIRQQMLDLLCQEEMDIRGLSQALKITEKEVLGHLDHIARSVKVINKSLVITPYKCLVCGFEFKNRQRVRRPSRCPQCRRSHLSPAFFQIK